MSLKWLQFITLWIWAVRCFKDANLHYLSGPLWEIQGLRGNRVLPGHWSAAGSAASKRQSGPSFSIVMVTVFLRSDWFVRGFLAMSRGDPWALGPQLDAVKMLCVCGCKGWCVADGLAGEAEGHVPQFGISWSGQDLLPSALESSELSQ